MQNEIELPVPIHGVSDDQAFSKQPSLTCPDALNARVIGATSGRTQRAKRAGLSRLSSTPVNGANVPVKRMLQTVHDARKVTYTGITATAADDVVKYPLPLKKPCFALFVDKHGNVHAVDGLSTVFKANATGERQWSFALSVLDPQHVCRALAVDDYGIVYVGTSSGGGLDDQGRLWALIEKPGNQVEVLWEIETKAFVEEVKVYKSRLVTLQNKPSTGEAWIVVYDGVTTEAPAEAFRQVASAGPNGLAVGPTGNIYVVAESVNPRPRGYDPRLPAGKITIDWKLSDLLDKTSRIWREQDPQSFLDEEAENGDDVTVWSDSSGNGRNLLQKPAAGAPTLILRSLGRLPAVSFAGSSAAVPQILTTGPNYSTNAGFADRQQSFLPAYQQEAGTPGYTDNAQTVLVMLVSTEHELVNGKGMGFFKQDMTGIAAGNSHFIAFNKASNNVSLSAGLNLAGTVRYQAGTLAAGGVLNGGGTGNCVAAGAWNTSISNAVLITLVLNHGTTGVNTDHPSQLRVNGTLADEFDLRNTINTLTHLAGTFNPAEIGALDFGSAANFEPFRGAIHYIAVFNRYTGYTNNAPIKYPFTQNAGTATFPPDASGDSEIERVEGGIAHRFGVAHILPAGHPFSDTKGPPNRSGITAHSLPWLINTNHQTLTKYSPSGEIKAVVASYAAYRAFAAQTVGGIGFGVGTDSDGNVYTMGPHALAASGTPADDFAQLRKFLDNGDSFTFIANTAGATASSATASSAAGAWSKTYNDYTEQVGVANVDILAGYHYPRVGVDTQDVVYFPWSATAGAFSGVALIAYDKTGGNGLVNNRAITGNNGLGLSFAQNGYVGFPDPDVPVYDATSLAGAVQNAKLRAEYVWLATDLGTGGGVSNETVHKVRLVSASRTTGSPRVLTLWSVAGGAVKRGTAIIAAPAGAGTLAQPELASGADFISGFVLFGKAYFIDGLVYRVADPKKDTVLEWKAKKGRIPPRCKLGVAYRGRAVLARSADDGHLWHMAAQGDPDDWEVEPPAVTPTQAASGSGASRIGRCPDIINALIDVNDDEMLFGCDHSIWRLRGDPQAGGEFDLVSDVLGVSFGAPSAKDPYGNVYVFLSRGGVARVPPGGFPQRISSRSIERRLQSIDLSAYHVGMEWDYEDEGLRVFVLPFAGGGTPVKHYFWDAKNEGWWPDQYGRLATDKVQPTATTVLDGDLPNDRRIIIAGEDGFLRIIDRAATKDDQTAALVDVPFLSKITEGPVLTNEGMQGRIVAVTAERASALGHCQVNLYASDVADMLGDPRASFVAARGRNSRQNVRAKGSYTWIEVTSVDPRSTWAIERLSFEAARAGRNRVTR